jgi:hypothetical protein
MSISIFDELNNQCFMTEQPSCHQTTTEESIMSYFSGSWTTYCNSVCIIGRGAYSEYIQQVCLPIQNVHIQGYRCTIFYSNTAEI